MRDQRPLPDTAQNIRMETSPQAAAESSFPENSSKAIPPREITSAGRRRRIERKTETETNRRINPPSDKETGLSGAKKGKASIINPRNAEKTPAGKEGWQDRTSTAPAARRNREAAHRIPCSRARSGRMAAGARIPNPQSASAADREGRSKGKKRAGSRRRNRIPPGTAAASR